MLVGLLGRLTARCVSVPACTSQLAMLVPSPGLAETLGNGGVSEPGPPGLFYGLSRLRPLSTVSLVELFHATAWAPWVVAGPACRWDSSPGLPPRIAGSLAALGRDSGQHAWARKPFSRPALLGPALSSPVTADPRTSIVLLEGGAEDPRWPACGRARAPWDPGTRPPAPAWRQGGRPEPPAVLRLLVCPRWRWPDAVLTPILRRRLFVFGGGLLGAALLPRRAIPTFLQVSVLRRLGVLLVRGSGRGRSPVPAWRLLDADAPPSWSSSPLGRHGPLEWPFWPPDGAGFPHSPRSSSSSRTLALFLLAEGRAFLGPPVTPDPGGRSVGLSGPRRLPGSDLAAVAWRASPDLPARLADGLVPEIADTRARLVISTDWPARFGATGASAVRRRARAAVRATASAGRRADRPRPPPRERRAEPFGRPFVLSPPAGSCVSWSRGRRPRERTAWFSYRRRRHSGPRVGARDRAPQLRRLAVLHGSAVPDPARPRPRRRRRGFRRGQGRLGALGRRHDARGAPSHALPRAPRPPPLGQRALGAVVPLPARGPGRPSQGQVSFPEILEPLRLYEIRDSLPPRVLGGRRRPRRPTGPPDPPA